MQNYQIMQKPDHRESSEFIMDKSEFVSNSDSRIRFYTFGGFKCSLPLPTGPRTPRKQIALLRVLLVLGGRNVSLEKLSQTLWPDSETSLAAHALETTLYRLRKLLGDRCIETKNGQLSFNPDQCWLDIWAFDELSESSEGSLPLDTRAQALVEVYRGSFFEGDDTPVVVIQREKFHWKFLRTICSFGEQLEAQNNYDFAIRCYLRAIEVDPLAEELYRRLMKCYQHVDRTAEALATYERCFRTLMSVLNTEPTNEMKSLREAIQSCKRAPENR
jgi:DNA-binding SARP family transcriptional activator